MGTSAPPVALAVLASSSPSIAQANSLDTSRANAGSPPADGAAAGQAGMWNRMSVTAGTALVDLGGAATGASVSSSTQHNFNSSFDNPLTTDDDEVLLDAGHDGALTLGFVGLANGEYLVWAYAWAADKQVNYITDVAVSGSPDPIQPVGGAVWISAHASVTPTPCTARV